jgi:hypothetical protein
MTKLYEIAENIRQLEVLLEQMDEDDATFDMVKEYLDKITHVNLSEKVENVAKVVKNLESDAEMYKAEKMRLADLQKKTENKAENLKNYLATTLASLGYDHVNKKKVKTSIGNVGFRKSQASLDIVDIDKVPSEWSKPQQREIRKADLLKHLKGELGDLSTVDVVNIKEYGVRVVNNKSTLQIK